MQIIHNNIGHRKHRQVPRKAHKGRSGFTKRTKQQSQERILQLLLQDTKNPESCMDPFTLGKEKAATDLIGIIGKTPDQRNRLHVLRWSQTMLSRFGRGLNNIKAMSNPHSRTEIAVLWRKYWLAVVDKKGTVRPEIRSHLQSIIHGRTKEVIKLSMGEIADIKEAQKLGANS